MLVPQGEIKLDRLIPANLRTAYGDMVNPSGSSPQLETQHWDTPAVLEGLVLLLAAEWSDVRVHMRAYGAVQ